MKKRRKKKKNSNRLGIVSISLVVFLFSVVVIVKGMELNEKKQDYILKEQKLQVQLDDEKDRSSQLEERKKYVQTKKYIEDVAKEKLGLVYEDEIIFKPSQD